MLLNNPAVGQRSQTCDNFGHFEEASQIPGRPIHNSLYNPSYAAIDLPVDPHLRALKQNPNFCNLTFIFNTFVFLGL
ncbi:hypothetical protein RND71_041124 [Anisodus tanguticus]|uniref:Uncharacterized protein n=1 Tax=Anisodus tanguticus TaxID=243964 RepID=A0AAE1QX22_9SOLA|nr:hypothetical protein RND71_041124 [Anisodus tanguticus]